MRCADCGTRARRRDLRRGRCRACGHAFAFDPSRDPYPVTDAQLKAAVDEVSSGGRLFFTARQLWYELHRQRTRPPGWTDFEPAFGPVAGAGTVALGPLGVVPLGLLPMLGMGVAVWVGVTSLVHSVGKGRARKRRERPPEIPLDLFVDHYLARWTEARGAIPTLVAAPAPDAAPRAVPADVAAFSFDRAVVTQHADVAAMLVANRFHFEHACAVLSLDGYPYGIAETVKEMLRRNPRLTVFFLHDASVEAIELLFALRDPAWFPDPATLIVDAGIRSAGIWSDTPALPGPPVTLSERVREELKFSGPRWYEAGNRAELAGLPPASVMRMLQGAFSTTGMPGEPRHDIALAEAAATGGITSLGALSLAAGGTDGSTSSTAATDGFG